MKCPVCNCASEFEFTERVGEFEMLRCRHCDVIFSSPMKSLPQTAYEQSMGGIAHKMLGERLAWWHDQFFEFIPRGEGRSIIDVGCTSGIFINEARKRGFRVCGLDFDRQAIEIARGRFGLDDLHSTTLEEFHKAFPERKFDFVTMFELIEHVDDPTSLVRTAKAMLKEGGALAISTPNRDRTLDVIKDIDKPPVHLTRWSKRALSGFLERNGFRLIHFVVKRLDHLEVASYLQGMLRFGVATRLAVKAASSGEQKFVKKARFLTGVKSKVTTMLTLPAAPFLKGLQLQGFDMFCICGIR